MNRRHFIRNSAILGGSGLLIGKSGIASVFGPQAYNVRILRNNVGIFTEKGGTIGFLLAPEGTVVIDSQFSDTAPHLIEEMKTRNTAPIRYLLNTHHHGDHTGGNLAFKGLVDHVVAHENSLINQKAVAEKNNALDKTLLPDITFKDDWKLKIGDEKIKADYYGAGHTNGDAVYHFENSNIFHAGDLMFNKRHPFVDRSAGANIASWVKDLDKVIRKANKESLIIFGHSLNAGEEVGTIEDLKKFQDYLSKLLAFAASSIKSGMSKEEFIKSTAIPGVTEWSGQGIERPLTAAYEELSAK
jgi:glyoxylase-like metal-dependent hydrolase (beta-lactamase superfamily II)